MQVPKVAFISAVRAHVCRGESKGANHLLSFVLPQLSTMLVMDEAI